MKVLEKIFTGRAEVRGFEFEQIKEKESGFIYRVKTPFATIHYEVFERKTNSQYDCVSYPQSPAFGVWAWSFTNYEDAIKKFEEL